MTFTNGTESARPWNLPLWQRAVLFSVGYIVCAQLGSYLSARGTTYVSFWMPAGLSVAVLLLSRTRDWPWLLLAAVPANFLFDYWHGTKPLVTLCFCFANVVEAFIGAWLVRRFVSDCPRLKTLNEFIGLIGLGAVLNSVFSAAIGAATLVYFGISHSFIISWKVWWGSDVMAVLLLAPFILTWFPPWAGLRQVFNSGRKIAEAVLLFAGLGACLWYLLAREEGVMSPNKSIAIPFLLWAGLRFGVYGATAACLFMALVFSFFTAQFYSGLSPALITSGGYVFVLQTVVATAVLVSIIPAIVLGERDRTMTKLRESEEKFSKAFRTSPDVMSIADLETGRYLEVNDAHEKTFGFTREQTLGHSPLELGILKNSKAREEMIASLKAHGRISNREIEARSRDGEPLTLVYSAEVIKLGGRLCVLRVSHDITARKRAEEALRESERRFRSYFELASVGFAITSRDMRMLAVNDEYCRIVGYSREELLNKTWAELTYPADLKSNEVLFQEAMAGKTDAYTLNKRLVRKDGAIINGTISARCIRRPDGSPDYFVSLLLDVTEREQAIEREQRARAEYTLQLIASQEAERARIAGELHDSLGQSLSIIKNHAQLMLLPNNLPTDARKQIETISDTTTEAIAEMRRISQDLHPYQLDHLGLTRALDALVESTGNASNIAFKKKFDMVDDVFLRDSASTLYRIVQEGVNNILKHSHAKNCRVTLERDIREVQLRIEDDGQGFKADEASNGMGLKNIAERTRILGGRLKVDSAPGQGTRIEINIPISPGPE
jgi:PAS domain S-box-containing protein